MCYSNCLNHVSKSTDAPATAKAAHLLLLTKDWSATKPQPTLLRRRASFAAEPPSPRCSMPRPGACPQSLRALGPLSCSRPHSLQGLHFIQAPDLGLWASLSGRPPAAPPVGSQPSPEASNMTPNVQDVLSCPQARGVGGYWGKAGSLGQRQEGRGGVRLRLSSNPLSLWCPQSVGLHVSRVAVSEVTSERRHAFPREPPRPRGHPGNLPRKPRLASGRSGTRDAPHESAGL